MMSVHPYSLAVGSLLQGGYDILAEVGSSEARRYTSMVADFLAPNPLM